MPSGADENTGAVTAVLSYVESTKTVHRRKDQVAYHFINVDKLVSFTFASSDRKIFQNFKVSSPAHISIICPLGDTARTTYLSSRSMSISKRSLPFFMFRASHRRRRPSPPTEGNDQTSRA
ncbi:hypothetical protein IGI04_035204 [Brassica rapa subsp. trilocularis]|uniref:Uncharacterized protein n=1 Tax=Brassica rapa subsp. trilocularis TaxID=1813537 RepID=A0ABQ7LAX7_BRACM|nr:hypothetical protein IGI04_035204 [Brassica rapa subsp. trilocularis]